ncbi:DUF3817 domain-containing protein [Arthrobacter alpinus]|nr:DUF3817 domain-containing protein [Arthrobacter alpinus]
MFIAYVTTAVLVGLNQRWPKRQIVGAAATAFVPYLTIPFDKWLEKKNMLDGGWRTTATDHPAMVTGSTWCCAGCSTGPCC